MSGVNNRLPGASLRAAMEMCVGVVRLNPNIRTDNAQEATIIDRCRKRDVEAFGKFVDLYQARVFGFVRRMVVNADEAADVTQEVFIRAFQNFERFDGRSSVRTWLFRIAHNLCIDRARKIDRRFTEVGMVSDQGDGEEIEVSDVRWEPEQILLTEELQRVVEEAISAMSEKLRSVLILHDREELQYDEIAQILNVPIGTVKSRLFLARNHLQSVLKNYFDTEVAG